MASSLNAPRTWSEIDSSIGHEEVVLNMFHYLHDERPLPEPETPYHRPVPFDRGPRRQYLLECSFCDNSVQANGSFGQFRDKRGRWIATFCAGCVHGLDLDMQTQVTLRDAYGSMAETTPTASEGDAVNAPEAAVVAPEVVVGVADAPATPPESRKRKRTVAFASSPTSNDDDFSDATPLSRHRPRGRTLAASSPITMPSSTSPSPAHLHATIASLRLQLVRAKKANAGLVNVTTRLREQVLRYERDDLNKMTVFRRIFDTVGPLFLRDEENEVVDEEAMGPGGGDEYVDGDDGDEDDGGDECDGEAGSDEDAEVAIREDIVIKEEDDSDSEELQELTAKEDDASLYVKQEGFAHDDAEEDAKTAAESGKENDSCQDEDERFSTEIIE